MAIEPMTPMTMAMSSMSTFRRRKGKNCYDEDLNLSEADSYCFRSEHSCFWNNSNNNCYWSKHDCSGNNIISFKMMLKLEWSGLEKATATSTTIFRDSCSRVAATTTSQIGGRGYGRRCRYSFFVHGRTKSLIQPFWPTKTKDSNQCASWEIDRWCWRRTLRDNGCTRKGFDMIDLKPTRMHAQLNCRYSCTVDPSWTQDWIVAKKTVETRRVIEQPTTR